MLKRYNKRTFTPDCECNSENHYLDNGTNLLKWVWTLAISAETCFHESKDQSVTLYCTSDKLQWKQPDIMVDGSSKIFTGESVFVEAIMSTNPPVYAS